MCRHSIVLLQPSDLLAHSLDKLAPASTKVLSRILSLAAALIGSGAPLGDRANPLAARRLLQHICGLGQSGRTARPSESAIFALSDRLLHSSQARNSTETDRVRKQQRQQAFLFLARAKKVHSLSYLGSHSTCLALALGKTRRIVAISYRTHPASRANRASLPPWRRLPSPFSTRKSRTA